ncbi:MAG: DNA-formamidopyrimidine glycosylase family protein, partial [Candidatus Eisenbacteria bacterium]
MPELPEVETIRLRLRDGRSRTGTWAAPPLPGQTITAGRVLWEPTLVTPTARRFRARVRGQRIVEVSRRGKFIVLHLTEDTLLFHLRMGGDFQVEPRARPLSPYARLTLDLGARWRLVFCNPRKFGRVWLTDR